MTTTDRTTSTEGLAELLLNSTGEGIYGIDLQGNCTFANPACVQLLGFDTDDELLGRNMHNLVHHSLPNGMPYAMEDCRIYRAFRVGEGVRVDDEVLWRRDGSSFPAEYWSYPMEREGELTGSVLTFVDITERRIAEMRLRDSEERTRMLLNSTGEGIYGIDLQGNCTFANPACVQLLGFDTDDELLGRNMHNLVHHSLPNGMPYAMEDCRIYRAFRVGEGVRVDDEVLWRRDGSSFPAEYWSYPMEREGELTGSVLTFVDITERRQMEVRLRNERERAESLLLNVLPAAIAERLKKQPGRTLAERFDAVSVLFADLVGFTPLAARLSPEASVDLLNDVFTAFDAMTVKHGLEKIKTIGDGYMVVGGAPEAIDDRCATMARLALDMQSWMTKRAQHDGLGLKLRVGINCGPAVGAIVGTKKFQYDLWGDAVNVASRMESSGSPGRIQVTETVRDHLGEEFGLESRGAIDVKGKGRLRTWFVDSAIS